MYCQLEVLRHCFPSSVRRTLEELPESLDETYERILRGIKKPNQGHAHRLLQCLVAAARPLRVRELAEVLAVDFDTEGIPKLNPDWRWQDQEEAVISACSSLVMIVNSKDPRNRPARIVQFSHFSVKEFLTANRLAEPTRDVSYYHIRLEAAHTILAQACLGVLLRLDDSLDNDSRKGFPMARYAAMFWFTHAQFENVSSRIKDGMECLFDADKPHFAAWIWVHNEDSRPLHLSTYGFTKHPVKPEAVPLYYAALLGFSDLARHLIARNPEHVNAKGGTRVTPMNAAAIGGHAETLSLLLEHGADVDPKGVYGFTPLHDASFKGHLEAGRCLLDHGADINARCDRYFKDSTPLHHAASFEFLDYTRMLLKRGAAINVVNDRGNTPLHSSLSSIHSGVQIVQLLLDFGADVNARNSRGEAPLHRMENRHDTEVARLLLEHGADVHAKNNDGFTVGQLASCRFPSPNLALIELLRQYGDTSL